MGTVEGCVVGMMIVYVGVGGSWLWAPKEEDKFCQGRFPELNSSWGQHSEFLNLDELYDTVHTSVSDDSTYHLPSDAALYADDDVGFQGTIQLPHPQTYADCGAIM